MDYLEVIIELNPRTPWAEILVAELADLGFESFVDTPKGIEAYAPVTIGKIEELIKETSVYENTDVEVSFRSTKIPYQNWNAEWEANFEPVLIDERLVIIAPFHDQSAFGSARKIVIQPQMSFGTGHHQTTFLMSQYLLDLDEMPSKVLDMGTGTGVLAILSEFLGAEEIVAVDIEPWSVVNTRENAERNKCSKIKALEGDIDVTFGNKFGLILANINKNVLKVHLPEYAKQSEMGGLLYLSGFFETDVEELEREALKVGFELKEVRVKETWASMKLIRK
jgi:ribosomal protein L11 methyltransferase